MRLSEFIKQTCYEVSGRYYAINSGNLMCSVFQHRAMEYLAENEITHELSDGLGYSPLHDKWFTWGPRGVRSYGVGSEFEGNIAKNLEGARLMAICFSEGVK